MVDPKESRFWQATLLSGLMDAQKLTACWNAISPGKRDDPHHIDRRLARQAVQANALTLWQAQQLMAGRTSGYKVDRYVLLDLIGQGGMGRVYLAQDTRLNRQVALKILSPERINNPRAIARFQREARVGAQLQHENLVRIYDFGESSGRFFLVMEYIEGKTIGTLITEQGPIPPATAVRLARQVAMGLEHAHRKGLIHRDVNPYNVLVTRDGTAKLADLGLAIDLAEDDHVTREGATVGTFDYVAPEQARHSHSADIRSDIYSLGCSLYHMCTGQVPFPTPSLPEKLFAHQAMEPPPLEQFAPDLPEGLAEVVKRMMHKSPDERYATPLQVAQALEPFGDEYSIPTGKTEGQLLKSAPAGASQSAAKADAPNLSIDRSVGLKTPPDLAVERVGAPEVKLASTVASPVSAQGSDPEFPVDLILSPEPSLTEGLARPKTRSPSNSSGTSEARTLPRLPRSWLWGLVAVTATVLLVAVVLAVVNPFGESTGSLNKPASAATTKDAPSLQKSPEDAEQTPDNSKPAADIIVRFEGEETRDFTADKLADAISVAMGSQGRVELRNSKPLRLNSKNHKLLDFGGSRGTVIISAAPGTEPIIEFELAGSKPLLATGSGVTLKVSGITVLVHYPAAIQPSPVGVPPLISTAGKMKLERCAFIVAPGPHPAGCRALVSNMGALEIERCWFEGFDDAIEADADYRTEMKISQTMIVPSSERAPNQTQLSEGYGWGLKFKFTGDIQPIPKGTKPKPNLILDHCLVEGAGLFDLTSSRGPAPLRVAVNHCTFRTNSLLALNRKRPKNEDQIHWDGEGNQYDVRGRSWIVESASEGSPAFSKDVVDLESWLRITPGEKKTIKTKPKYLIDPATRSESRRPSDFAIEGLPLPEDHSGADPSLVGPWSKP